MKPPQIIHLEETASTNRYLQDYLQEERLPEGSAVIAAYQTAGRGQAGNAWESAPGMNLTFSIVVYPESIPANEQFILSQLTSLAVAETLQTYTGGISVKWPNDIYRLDKKICGILIENTLLGEFLQTSVIGIGLNLNQTEFTGNAPNPVSLRQITGKEHDREEVLHNFLQRFYRYYLRALEGRTEGIRQAYMESLYRRDGFHAYCDSRDPNRPFDACILGVEPSGHLLLRLKDGQTRRYAFKEVRFL
ncbi:biotin--[acetyl-CoA-carboxylase] ligase [Bacteroidia bacterium]|nr:biotin--[acetyl-CoA-carboxylase] ligase [Bacteroidia bacterium]